MHEGYVSTTIGLKGISPLAETIAVSQLIQLASATGVHLHLSQLSCADSVKQLRKAKAEGVNVSADVAIQNLLYTDDKVESFASIFHCLPPLRESVDRLALIEGVKEGIIDAVTSAHQPHEAAAKLMPFAETEPGMSTIEFLLPMAQILADNDELDLACFIKSMTRGASSILKQKESLLKVGDLASFSVYDSKLERTITSESIVSRGKNSPLLGKVIKGETKATLFKGRVVYEI